jgi:hypothetical protein
MREFAPRFAEGIRLLEPNALRKGDLQCTPGSRVDGNRKTLPQKFVHGPFQVSKFQRSRWRNQGSGPSVGAKTVETFARLSPKRLPIWLFSAKA